MSILRSLNPLMVSRNITEDEELTLEQIGALVICAEHQVVNKEKLKKITANRAFTAKKLETVLKSTQRFGFIRIELDNNGEKCIRIFSYRKKDITPTEG